MLVNLFTYLLYINCYAMKKEGRYFFDIFAILTKPRVSWIKPRRKSSTNTSPTPLIAIEDESVDESVDKYVITREEEVNIAMKCPFLICLVVTFCLFLCLLLCLSLTSSFPFCCLHCFLCCLLFSCCFILYFLCSCCITFFSICKYI